MGLTFIAAGVSVPDALSGVAVVKEGEARDLGPRVVVQGPRVLVQGPRVLVQWPRVLVQGPRVLVQGPRVLVPRPVLLNASSCN